MHGEEEIDDPNIDDLSSETNCDNMGMINSIYQNVLADCGDEILENETSDKSEMNNKDDGIDQVISVKIDSEYQLEEIDEILDSDPSSPCTGFTDEMIAEAECRKKKFKKTDAIFLATNNEDISCDPSTPCEGFTDEEIAEAKCRKIDAIILATYKEDMSRYDYGTPTGTNHFCYSSFSTSKFATFGV